MSGPVIAIVGPTAAGKTAVAQAVALRLNGEVVSADSMQVYRGMDIGTGKIPVKDRLVPHFGLDLVDPDETYSAALFQAYARRCFQEIDARGHRALLAGGTGFYVRAALDAMDFAPGEQRENPVRERFSAMAAREGAQAVWDHLHEVDPESAEVIHPHNVRRVIRALEMHAAGESYADRKQKFAETPGLVDARYFGLQVDPQRLNALIEARVDAMMEAGLLGEVTRLVDAGFAASLTAKQAIGYKELIDYLEGRVSLEEAVTAIKQATRRLAKRQRTWFRRDGRIRWLDADDGDIDRLADEIVAALEGE